MAQSIRHPLVCKASGAEDGQVTRPQRGPTFSGGRGYCLSCVQSTRKVSVIRGPLSPQRMTAIVERQATCSLLQAEAEHQATNFRLKASLLALEKTVNKRYTKIHEKRRAFGTFRTLL